MKQRSISLLLLLLPLIGFAQNPQDWSGTARFVRNSYSQVNTQTSKVSYIIDIAIKKGIGNATVSYSVNLVDNSKESSYSEVGSCSRNEETELALTFYDDGIHYDVAIAAPACEGLLNVTRDGHSNNREFGADESIFQLEHKKRGDNPDVLKGEERSRVSTEGGYTEEIYTWNFTTRMEPDLLVTSPQYEMWMPEPSDKEDVFGNVIPVDVILKREDDGPLYVKVKEFFVQLVYTSKESGVTINHPPQAMSTGKYDMILADEKAVPAKYFDGQKFTIPCDDGKSARFYILSFDGGGHTMLEVKAIMADGTEMKGQYGKPGGPTSIPYPYRDRGSRIAKIWLELNGNPKESDDNEVTPGSPHNGDGLTAYEEYRGVISQKGFKRLSPLKKELAIRVDKANLPLFKKGIDLFAKLTDITPVIVYEDQLEDTRIFNRNSLNSRAGIQYGLYLKPKPLGNAKGQVMPPADFKTTKNTDEILINTIGIMKQYDSMAAIKKLPYDAEEDLANVVAHYLCQGVGIPPHGNAGNGEVIDPATNPSLKIQYLQENGQPLSAAPKLVPHLVGGPHNDASGDAGCVMCINNKYVWSYSKTGNNIIYRKVPVLAPGKKICSSPLGTMINKNGEYFSNAANGRGNCIKHIKVKSW